MKKITFVYISLSGNTESFVTRLTAFLIGKHNQLEVESINVKHLVKKGVSFFPLGGPFIAFLPTYLEGGNGIDTGNVEILTSDLGDFISYEDNSKKCLGIVGSGNRNFNDQYCLTAKQYAKRFQVPVLDSFELRGLRKDVNRISSLVEKLYDL